jgi:hypothetical protein
MDMNWKSHDCPREITIMPVYGSGHCYCQWIKIKYKV